MPFVFHVHCLFHIECIRFFFFHISLVWFSRLPGSFVALLLHYQSFTISFEPQCYTLDSNIHFLYLYCCNSSTNHISWLYFSVSACESFNMKLNVCLNRTKYLHICCASLLLVCLCERNPCTGAWESSCVWVIACRERLEINTFDTIDVIITVHQNISQRFIHIALRIIASYLHNSNQDAASVSF